MNSKLDQDITDALEKERVERISIDAFRRGIDNYHIDVWLSPNFCDIAEKVTSMLVSQIGVPNPKTWDNSKDFQVLRGTYLDLMTVLIHRVKTDLTTHQVCLLQFAVIKHLLMLVNQNLDKDIGHTQTKLSAHQDQGSSEALTINQRLFWLKKNYDNILYKVNRQIFAQIQRVEERHLRSIREQYLGSEFGFIGETMTNPLLFVSELSSLPLLLNEFSAWTWSCNDEIFNKLNNQLEKLLNKRFKGLTVTSLRGIQPEYVKTEIHDELGGLFSCQAFLGPAADTRNELSETLNWFEIPENIKLFQLETADSERPGLFGRRNLGQRWQQRKNRKRVQATALALRKLLNKNRILPQVVASNCMRKQLHPTIADRADLKDLCQFLAGKLSAEDIHLTIPGGLALTEEQVKTLEGLRESVSESLNQIKTEDALRYLVDFSRYRRLLKHYRFAHRAFNRIRLLSDEDDIKLSKTAGSLYQLPMQSEIEEEDHRIVHHAILKADIRGSTLVTQELLQKGLNPASYFSMRFFNPINNSLEAFGADKVFIEGDAIILSFLEQEKQPQQWFSVARACGIAKEMLKIVAANNRHSAQMELPLLELGIGICFSDESPNYLYDGDRPIMISTAIADADRMSSCSWKLRKAIEKRGLYNVIVLRLDEKEEDFADKGQRYLRYNVNGINLDTAAFLKLNSEVALRKIRMRINNEEQLFHVGQFPDAKGNKRDLVVREGKTGLWKGGNVVEIEDSEECFYEVVVNRKVLPLVIEYYHQSQSSATGS